MGKSYTQDGQDDLLAYAKDANRLCLCSQQPTTGTEALSTYAMAVVTVDLGDFTGPVDFTDENGSGRKVTVAAQSEVAPSANGNATHVALVYQVTGQLLAVTPCPSQAVAVGTPANIEAWDIKVYDPS